MQLANRWDKPKPNRIVGTNSNTMKKILTVFEFVCLAFASCQKDKNLNQPNTTRPLMSTSREAEADEAKYDDMIETAANGMLELRKNSTFRTLVNAQLAL